MLRGYKSKILYDVEEKEMENDDREEKKTLREYIDIVQELLIKTADILEEELFGKTKDKK